MRTRTAPTFAALAALAALLAACAGAPVAPPAPPAPPPAATPVAAAPAAPPAPEPTTPEGLLPGIPLDGLDEGQKAVAARIARDTYVYCGTPHTISQRLRQPDGGCDHAKRMGRLVARLAGAGVGPTELARHVTEYYSSFDPPRRARLELAGFGPPYLDADKGITLVEFSDFTCPYCQLFRPVLEKFVAERAGRVRLFFKPFPIESHPGALELAQAGEWAREKGAFWKMHDALFEDPHAVTGAALSSLARRQGLDGDDLEAALNDGRLLPRVRASQAEARAAGLRGTPTLFFEGRRLAVPDFSEWMLEFTLQDEEEWQAHRGWSKDARP
jgi:protein-disulfide isomerase